MTKSQPLNILLVMADQMTPFLLDACGHQGARMKHLSALADRGVQFTNAYTSSPICAPARAGFMTGLHTSTTGCFDNGDPFPSYIPTFAHHLAKAGYETVLSGKMHFIGADQLHGFQRRLNTDLYPAGFLWSYPMLPEDDPEAMAFDFAPQYQPQYVGPGWSKELQYDEETQFRALEYLRHAPDRPWMLTVSFTNPHPPYQVPQKYWQIYKDADLPLPEYGPDMEQSYSDFDRAFLRWYGLDRTPLSDPAQILQARRAFAALSHYVDDKLGELLDVLDEKGLRDNTMVIFTADHGEMLGEKGLIQKRSFYEWSARIPMVIDMPGSAAAKVDTPVSLLDLPATIVDLAGQELVRPMQGRSLIPALTGGELNKVPVIAEYHGEGIMRPSFMVRLGDWKMIYSHGTPHQLFNLADDPMEQVNRAGDADAAKAEARLLEEITGGQFDLETIEAEVWARLPQKQLVNAAMAASRTTWDHVPMQDVMTGYVRS